MTRKLECRNCGSLNRAGTPCRCSGARSHQSDMRNNHDSLVFRLTQYFDLCSLAAALKEDKEITADIAGSDRTFSNRAEVEMHRDAIGSSLRGYCNVLRK